MHDEHKLRQVFAAELGLPPDEVTDALAYGENPAWDSIAHMALVAAIEAEFGILIDADDVIGMNTFAEAGRIVARCADPV